MNIRRFHFALILLLTLAARSRAEETNFFPVMAWNGVPSDLAALKQMRECGFTVAGFTPPAVLKLCRKAGLKAIVSDARVSGYDWNNVNEAAARSNILSLVKQVGKNPAVFGYYLRDEPGAGSFSGLAKVASILREAAPGKWAYINLFPNYATAGQMGVETYPQYVQQFVDTCRPIILSYDHYAFYEGGTMGGDYFRNLEQMRAAGLSNSLPFWNIVQGMGLLAFREPSIADIRFQIFTSLAYGARGIAYFQYQASPHAGNFRMSAIDQFGHQTQTWFSLQNVNLQIAALAPTLLQLTSDDVYHFGSVPGGCHASTTNDLISGFDAGDFVAGDFTHRDGSRYVMIVNKNLNGSIPCLPHYRKAPKSVEAVSPYTGQLTDFSGEAVWLAPGHGVLLKVK